MLSEKAISAIKAEMARYPNSRSALMPALYIAQEECQGWVSPEAVADVAVAMGLEAADVQATMSFYTMYYKRPVGRYIVEICHNVTCSLLGAQRILHHLESNLGIGLGETTEDGLFTLRAAECMASCGGAPCMQINSYYHENLTVEKVDEILDRCRAEAGNGQAAAPAVAVENTPSEEEAR